MSSIELDQIFASAIEREIEAHEFYLAVSEKVVNPYVKKVFAELAQEELGHKEFLIQCKNNPALLTKIEIPQKDYKIAEATDLPRFDIGMKPADAIALAMKKEEEAVRFYRGMAAISRDAEIKSQFDSLAAMELTHKSRLENIYVDIGYPEVF